MRTKLGNHFKHFNFAEMETKVLATIPPRSGTKGTGANMTQEETNKTIKEYMGDYSCYDCKHYERELVYGGESFPKCNHDDHYFDEIECGDFDLAPKKGSYCTSLDKLLPVWEKMGLTGMKIEKRHRTDPETGAIRWSGYRVKIFVKDSTVGHISDTITEASAMATAKAILENFKPR